MFELYEVYNTRDGRRATYVGQTPSGRGMFDIHSLLGGQFRVMGYDDKGILTSNLYTTNNMDIVA